MKKFSWILLGLAALAAVGCGIREKQMTKAQQEAAFSEEYIVVGFSQLGAESDWRSENTQSMKNTFTPENGYRLVFEDGQQKQANQITAIRMFIQQEVDYIVLAPVTETGWDTVLQEAKDAEIPVIIVDRKVDVEDESLFTCWIGSDFELEGRKVAAWLKSYAEGKGIAPEELHIVNIQGTLGASAQLGRTKGLSDAAKENGWDLMAEVPGDFNQARGREVMGSLLKQYDNINVVYCENDNAAFGAIEAIEAAGGKVGMDMEKGEILVLSFDGVSQAALDCVAQQRIGCIGECNPHHGPRVEAVIRQLERGEVPDKFSYVDEVIYSGSPAVKSITVNGTGYEVELLKPEM